MPPPRRAPIPREQVADALVGVAPLVARWMERLLARHEPPITPAQYSALQAIGEGDVLGADLARRAGVSAAAISQLLASLEAEGLIRRVRGAADRRRQTLELTTDGEAALGSARAALRERLSALLEDLPGPEADALGRLLPRLEILLRGGTPPPRRPPPPRPPRPPV